jgi:hypothetical protein
MNRIRGLAITVFLLATLIAAPAFAYLVDSRTNEQEVYYYEFGYLVTRGYVDAKMYYIPEYGENRLSTDLTVTGYKWLAVHQTSIEMQDEDGGLSWSDTYHDVWTEGATTDTSSEVWIASNPDHIPGGVELEHNTVAITNRVDWVEDFFILVL